MAKSGTGNGGVCGGGGGGAGRGCIGGRAVYWALISGSGRAGLSGVGDGGGDSDGDRDGGNTDRPLMGGRAANCC